MKKKLDFLLLILVMIVFIVGCGQIGNKRAENNGIDWQRADLEELKVDEELPAKLDKVVERQHPNINSILVLKEGRLVAERYYNDHDQDSLFHIASVTKTVTSALTGIAIDEGHIEGVEKKVVDYFPEYKDEIGDSKFKELTIEHLLTMTDGLDWHSHEDMNKDEVEKNPIKYAFGLSFVNKLGEQFNYSTLDSQVLSGIITKATDKTALEFAEEHLFGPLNIEKKKWFADLQGNNIGGTALHLTTRDMAKIGQLYLNEGNWQGEQIIPTDWIQRSTKVHSEGDSTHEGKYGYHLWVTEVDDYQVYFAGGYGGQFIYVVPELELVVAMTSKTDRERARQHRGVIDYVIVPSVS